MASGAENALLEKLASMYAMEVPQKQMAMAVGLSEGRISQIVATAVFQEKVSAIVAQRFEDNKILNEGWDGVEAQALSIVSANLQWNKDPDFALRAASLANKAVRRGQFAQPSAPIGTVSGARVVIQLGGAFVAKLQVGDTAGNVSEGVAGRVGVPEIEHENAPVPAQQPVNPFMRNERKIVDVMTVDQVKDVFKSAADAKDAMPDLTSVDAALEGLFTNDAGN
jgi:hypothetical protein